ncbi:transcription termination/antitermination protein NusA [Candidatus Borkfalkia ceftriaxoniphila]|jgi:transcription termination factor nusA|uniref:Transcription termination/antitermination protein NusA n=1 Tax=Candidatus Borkfalkia ceftriaxoniphila TaxID=2508949 RepID=A0A4Q2K7L0_9FIRM|nr:transcription termination factor NusA [Candidatus Borkfalkia ceftriaxoniphila]RXZ58013.1 transcription termination/antitermination protein NusA [Candidatus Borkfalkia ceftriaxoniphila]
MVNKDFFLALADLEAEKGISESVFIEALQNALASAYKKQYESGASIVEVKLNPEKSTIKFYTVKTAVAEVEDKEKEISLAEAQLIKKSYKLGDEVYEEFVPKDFGRIAAQTAKQVILQKLHETERDNTLSEFSDKKDELMSCVVRKIDAKNVYVELGKGQIEGLMLPQDQVPGEKYEVNDRLKVYVKNIKNNGRNAQVLVSRAAAGLVKRLFEIEVPEIKSGAVVIKSISREAGQRTKMAIFSEDAQVDAVGACVGNKGARVNAVVEELGGEKVDIILWSENPLEFIAKALSPAKVVSVTQVDEKSAIAVVPDDKLSLAIGRDGQNARLAARLTGWKIDVKSESAAAKMDIFRENEEEEEEFDGDAEPETQESEENEQE